MSAWRWIVAGAVITALAVAIGFVLLDDDAVPGPGTVAVPATQPATTTTSTVAPSTTPTTAQPSDVPSTMATRDRVGEVEQILTDLFVGWYDAIYRADGDALWGVVASSEMHSAGTESIGKFQFIDEPAESDLYIEVLDLLRYTENCLVAFVRVDVSGLIAAGGTTDFVSVLWPTNRGWGFATAWRYPDDLWETDCRE